MSDVERQYQMNRRQVLKSLAVVGSISVAGCSSVLGPGGTVLGKIEVINSSFVANKVRLIVTRDDDTLIDRKFSLPAIDGESGTPGIVIKPLWSETQGQYTVHAVHYDESDNRETEVWEYTFTEEDYDTYYGDSHEDPRCIGAVVKIGSLSEEENAPIGISPTYLKNPCGSPNSQ